MISATHHNRPATRARLSLAMPFLALTSLALVSLSIAALPVSGAVAAPTGMATAGVTPAEVMSGACIDTSGVTVVVDFTDVGGQIEIGCASSDPATGRAALEAAGFMPTDSQPGLICAINANPNPCPATFEGSFWSYWHSSRDGEWTSYQVGADSSDPTPGEIEGWRYNDGSAGPGISPADAAATLPEAAEGTTDGLYDLAPIPAKSSVDPVLVITVVGLGAVVIVVATLLVVRSRRRRASGGN